MSHTTWDRCSGEGWTADPRPVPAELEDEYTAHEFTEAEQAAAATVAALTEIQQGELWAALDLHECPHCGRTYDSEISLMWCCNEDEERKRGIYRGQD